MNVKNTIASLNDEQYYTLPLLDDRPKAGTRQVAPVSYFQIKSELARLSLYIEDLIAKETAAIIELEAGLASIRTEISALKTHVNGTATSESDRVIAEVDSRVEELSSRIIPRQDAVNARTAKLASDLQLFETILEGKIEGVKGVISSSSGDIAKSIHESIVTTQASLQADISSELTDLGRLILKKVKESLESGTGSAFSGNILSKELDQRFTVIESLIRDKASVTTSSTNKDVFEKLKKIEESISGRADGRTEPDKSEIRELLVIMDSFDRLLKYLEGKGVVVEESVFAGVIGIRALIERYISKYGLEKLVIEGKFDPHKHRAMAVVQDPAKEDNDIIDVLLSGYLYKGMVLRSAEVIVNRRKD
jgi:molecular chaperone GrpE (heat shock protein)